jgi:protein TonB
MTDASQPTPLCLSILPSPPLGAPFEPGDRRLWVTCILIAVALHAAAVAMLLSRYHEAPGDDGTQPIVVDLLPFTGPPSESKENIAPGPLQQQAEPEPESPKPEQQQERKVENPTPPADSDVTLPPKAEKPVEAPREQPKEAAPETTARWLSRAAAAQVASWHRKIALQIERHKGYPAAARIERETGIAELAFTIDRQGRVTANRIMRTSGFAALDREAIETVKRAEPFPKPPPNMPGETFDFTVPIKFNVR